MTNQQSAIRSPQPPVSIGLAVYNGGRHLRPTLDSLLAQDFTDFELLISDNASTDDTAGIVADYARRDRRIRYHRNETNIGACGNFNLVTETARGRYFAWAACHDEWEPAWLGRCVRELQAEPDAVLCYTAARIIDPSGQTIETYPTGVDTRGLGQCERYMRVLGGCQPHAIYGLYRMDALRQVLPTRRALGPDDLVQAELSLMGPFVFVPEELFAMRRMADFGSWRSYFAKLGVELNWLAAPRLCMDYVHNHLDILRRHVPCPRRRLPLAAKTLASLLGRSWPVFGAIVLEGACPGLARIVRRRLEARRHRRCRQ